MNGTSTVLLGAALALPLAMLLACLSFRLRMRMATLLAFAPVPALAAALLASGGTLALPQALLGLRFVLDLPGALLLGVAALLWIAGGAYTSAWLRGRPDRGRFVVWWLLTLSGSIGVFMAADLVSFYLVFSMVSLAAYGLIVDDGTPRARRSGLIYVALALLGEAFLLMAFVLLAEGATGDGLLISDVMAALSASPWRAAILALVILGFGAKIGLVPFHVWMPLAYRAAPIPAAAVLSGAAVKAGVIGLIRFLPLDASMPGWGGALAAAGLLSAFYGVAIGITQSNPKAVLGYSSVSQMGVLATVFGMGLVSGNSGTALDAAFYAAHHTLVKGALFLAVGVAATAGARRPWPVLLPAAVLALGLGGLPLTGGALAKLVVKTPVGDGFVALLMSLSSAGTTLLMAHFLYRLAVSSARHATPDDPSPSSLPWLAMALASIAVPWTVYLTVMSGAVADAVAPAALWSAIWPMLLGGALAIAQRRWGRLPRIPDGDIAGVAVAGATRLARAAGLAMEWLDRVLRQWTVAGVSLLALAVVLAALMLTGH
ncbi:MAG TPA: complex I subunit 5 family protein [Acetobacteraceae bacterium]|nr:complex I subunit 5 family protein [Acetobacteraceae bacterium]